jgi:hypothetical protein
VVEKGRGLLEWARLSLSAAREVRPDWARTARTRMRAPLEPTARPRRSAAAGPAPLLPPKSKTNDPHLHVDGLFF